MRHLKIGLTFGVAPAAYIGVMVGLRLAGPNYMWESGRDLGLLLLWLAVIFGLMGGILSIIITAIGTAAKLRPGTRVFLIFAAVCALFIFLHRFGWCYACHQVFDRRTPHLLYGPTRSLLLTLGVVVLAIGLGALLASVAHAIRRSWRKHGVKRGFFLTLAVSLVVMALASYISTPSGDEPRNPDGPALPSPSGGVGHVLIIVDEGLTWDVIDPLLEEEKLPTFRHLIRNGASGKLATLRPTLSQPLWATIATGRSPAIHGIGGKINYTFPGMRRGIVNLPDDTWLLLPQILVRLNDRGFGKSHALGPNQYRVKTFWNIAGDCGIDVGVVGWRGTWPVENVSGFVVANMLHQDPPTDHVYPEALAHLIESIIDHPPEVPLDAFIDCAETHVLDDERASHRVANLKRVIANDLRYHAAAKKLFPAFEPPLMALGFLSLDGISHYFYWEHTLLRDPEDHRIDSYLARFTSEEIVACYGSVIENAYAFHDSLIGYWLKRFGEEIVIIVASDHGFEMNGNNHYYGAPGIIVMHGGPFKKGIKIEGATILDIAPTLLYLLGLPVPLDMEGRVLKEAISPAWLAVNPIRTIPTY